MIQSSKSTLVKLAAIGWYVGVMVLGLKSTTLFIEFRQSGLADSRLASAVVVGVLLGLLKERYLFSRVCKRNLMRIQSLAEPKVWQFFRFRLFFLIGTMVLLSNYLLMISEKLIIGKIALAVIEESVAIALLISSRQFWKANELA